MNQFKKLIKISTNKKIVNLVNPNDHQDATTRKYVDKKRQKRFIYSLFCQNMLPETSLLRHSSKKKATCWYHFFFLDGNRHFNFPFINDPHILSVFSVIKVYRYIREV